MGYRPPSFSEWINPAKLIERQERMQRSRRGLFLWGLFAVLFGLLVVALEVV